MTPSRSKVISTALRRGLRKRCPHCGEGRLFSGWSHLERCSICGLVFARNPGDTWAFTIIGDRLPLAAMIVLIYFGVVRSHRVLGLTMLVVLAALVVWTAPNRWGAGIALHYLSRVYWPDPADPIPPPRATAPALVTPSAEAKTSSSSNRNCSSWLLVSGVLLATPLSEQAASASPKDHVRTVRELTHGINGVGIIDNAILKESRNGSTHGQGSE